VASRGDLSFLARTTISCRGGRGGGLFPLIPREMSEKKKGVSTPLKKKRRGKGGLGC